MSNRIGGSGGASSAGDGHQQDVDTAGFTQNGSRSLPSPPADSLLGALASIGLSTTEASTRPEQGAFAQRDPILDQLTALGAGKRVIVFGGYSGLGYNDVDELKARIAATLDAESDEYGASNLLVVAGATADGIGVAYEVAKRKGLATAGIVSETARQYGTSRHCDDVVFVPDPQGNWKVLAPDGRSYMVSVAQNYGVYYAFGGGEVTVSELTEARERNIKIVVDGSFEPLPAKVLQQQNFNPMPVQAWLAETTKNNGHHIGNDGIVGSTDVGSNGDKPHPE